MPSTATRKKCYTIYNRALKSGAIVRPEQCSRCNSVKVIHGHHKDYSKPLDVQWLCSTCHGEVTTEESKAAFSKRMDEIERLDDTVDEPMQKFYTSMDIARETGLASYTVRYRLGLLRRKCEIKFKLFGQVYLYEESVIENVKNFGKVQTKRD